MTIMARSNKLGLWNCFATHSERDSRSKFGSHPMVWYNSHIKRRFSCKRMLE
jgi:hypothetical protein